MYPNFVALGYLRIYPMLHVYSDKTSPYVLSPESLDFYLAKGWYRMGANVFTTSFLFFNGTPYSAIWLRVDLKDFSFSKSQRKLLRRNATHFAPATAPRTIDAEREELYGRYSDNFDGRLSPTIADSLEDYNGETIFNTFETTVREKKSGKLVACSYFDLGAEAAASILGIYDPTMHSFSLGYYTMLLEVDYCLNNGIRYYYPGYVAPGYGRFAYKLRLGASDYYDLRTESWLPYSPEAIELEGQVEVQRRYLELLTEGVARHGFTLKRQTYPLFEAGLYDYWNDDYLPYPYFCPVGIDPTGNLHLVVFDPRERIYLLVECIHMVEAQVMFQAQYLHELKKQDCFTKLLGIHKIYFRTSDPDEIVNACVSLLNTSKK